MNPELEEGLYFRTNREIYWNIPQASGTRVKWTVPAGTRGVVRVNRSDRSVGFAFDNMTHPEYGLAPTMRKPGMPLLDWMTPVDKMKGPDAPPSEFTPMPDSEVPEPPEGFATLLSRPLAANAGRPAAAGNGRSAERMGQSGAQGSRNGSEEGRHGAARA